MSKIGLLTLHFGANYGGTLQCIALYKILKGYGHEVDVIDWLDNPSAVFVLDADAAEFDGVNIDRNFKEYLQHTMDRETMEMQNNEN